MVNGSVGTSCILTPQEVQPACRGIPGPLLAWRPGAGPTQGLHRLLWPSAVAGAARLLRWWGKVGMSSGSQGRGFSLK